MTMTIENPYWDAVREIPADLIQNAFGGDRPWRPATFELSPFKDHRTELTKTYAWAIPDPEALRYVVEASCGRLVEIGAGTGYWAQQLSALGVDVVAYDIAPPDGGVKNHWHAKRDETFHAVLRGDASYAALHEDRTLFLCWPPYADPMASKALHAYRGARLIYIGEGSGGCTGDDAFHRYLRRCWINVGRFAVTQWSGLHDEIAVYERKKK